MYDFDNPLFYYDGSFEDYLNQMSPEGKQKLVHFLETLSAFSYDNEIRKANDPIAEFIEKAWAGERSTEIHERFVKA